MSYYIDTNIFVYSAIAHPIYGKSCKRIIDDIENNKIQAYCGFLVPMELLGATAKIDPKKAALAVEVFFSLPINMIQVNQQILKDAAEITAKSGVSYDSIHAACMQSKNLSAIITEDITDWKKIKHFKIIRPLEYEKAVQK